MVLHLWLVVASAAAAPGNGPTLPESPVVAPPAAPSPSAPPLPARPGSLPASGGAGLPSRASILEPPPFGEEPAAPGEARPTLAKPEARPAGTAASPRHSTGKPKSVRPAAVAGRGVPPALPSLTTTALKNELRQSLSAPTEVVAPVSDRTRLEQLASEITQAREALRQETARLEALIKQRGSCDGEARSLPSESSPSAAVAATAAKDMAREQLESVSKAMKGMKPEQAAAVVSRLDRRLAAEVLRRMRPADAGGVMGYLKPELAAELATEIATRKPSPVRKGPPMKVAAAAIVQAESSRVSPGSGRASHHGRDDSFAQTFYRSLRKGDSPSPASSLQATPGTPSDGTSVAMPSAENAGTPERGAPARSVLPRERRLGRRGRAAFPLAASAAGDTRGEVRPVAGVQTGAELTAAGGDHLAAVGSPPIATQTNSRGHAWPETTLLPAGQGPLHGLAEKQWSKIVPESRDAAAQGESTVAEDSHSGSALPGAAEPPSLLRDAVYPHATTTATAHGARPARVFATPTAAASTATSDGMWLVQSPATPVAVSAPEPATLFGGFGTDSPPRLLPRASHAPVAVTVPTPTADGARPARVFAIPTAASAPEPATPFGGFGTDSPPQLPPRASRAPVATTVPTATSGGARPARVFAIPLAASAPEPATLFGGFGTDSPPQLPPRASHAPVAATATTTATEMLSKTTADGARPARVFATPPAAPAATSDGTRLARSFAMPVETSRLSRPPPSGASGRTAHPNSPRVLRTRPSRPRSLPPPRPRPRRCFPRRQPTERGRRTSLRHRRQFQQRRLRARARPTPWASLTRPKLPRRATAPLPTHQMPASQSRLRRLQPGLAISHHPPPSSPSPQASRRPQAWRPLRCRRWRRQPQHPATAALTEVPPAATGRPSRPAKPAPAGPPISSPTTAPPAPPAAETSALLHRRVQPWPSHALVPERRARKTCACAGRHR